MASHFSEKDIDEFRECFFLFARAGYIRNVEELNTIMGSLGSNPTGRELKNYLKEKGDKIVFADFLDIMHRHSKIEHIPEEILNAFRAYDPYRKGVISVSDLKHILLRWGDKLNPKEVNDLFREANVPQSGSVRYADFVNLLCPPKPDY